MFQRAMINDVQVQETLNAARLHALLRLSSSPAQSNRPARIATEAVTMLNVLACVFHRIAAAKEPEVVAAHTKPGEDPQELSGLASRLVKQVIETGRFHMNNDLQGWYPRDPVVAKGVINSYLGVPLFNAKGSLRGVAAILAGADRELEDQDLWWMETAAHLASVTYSCEAIEGKASEIEHTKQVAPSAVALLERTPDAQVERISQSEKLSILLVDDDVAVNNLIRRFLTRNGFKVDSASDGQEALKMFRPDAYDLVITDMMMPGINGWELVNTLRGVAPNIPVIIITGYSTNNNGVWNKQFLKSQGVLALINKPLDLDFLGSLLQDLVDKQGKN
jgi:CheY-like chemotaxis protein